MPEIFEYLGILIYFYLNEHKLIHIHAKKGEFKSKAEFFIINGIISEIKITGLKGAKPLKGKDLKDFEVFLENFGRQNKTTCNSIPAPSFRKNQTFLIICFFIFSPFMLHTFA